ncbi:hypothetical protein M3Y99_00379000 [Aphelenchoides fujianensis]|nr:hypothetical protein M3Y99_00379000 [Aphelenchoides fujianensis]
MFKLLVLSVVLLAAFEVSSVGADQDIWEEVKQIDVFRLKKSALACPAIVVGNSCPEENPLYFFKCYWATVLLAVMVGLIIISIFVNLIRCIFCY